jgi:hypothetical protein
MNSTTKIAAKVAQELNDTNDSSVTKKEGLNIRTETILRRPLKKIWERKVMHRECIRSILQAINEEDTFLWLSI